MFKLSQKSVDRLTGVHEDLVKIVNQAIKISPVDFAVLEGLRTLCRQRELYAAGATQTMNSRHLTGHAVDLVALVGGKACWHPRVYDKIAGAMFEVAAKNNVPLIWGGNWLTFKDCPHFELNRNFYKEPKHVR
jgi:peptidoglycan L-alanyl-D-glutamate endopeptidase CwlK